MGMFNGHAYYRSDMGTVLMSQGLDLARFLNVNSPSVKGNLVAINSVAENKFLYSQLNGLRYSHLIGLFSNSPGKFGLITGEPLSYTNWAPGQPDNSGGFGPINRERYAVIRNDGAWNDTSTKALPFIAEFTSPLIVFRQISGPKNGSMQGVGDYTICYERTNLITTKKDTCCFNITVSCNFLIKQRAANVNKTGFKANAFPNPAQSEFTLNLTSNNKKAISYSIADQLGRVLETRNGVAPNQNLKIGSTLKPGLYILQVTQGTNKVVSKLVKE